MQKIMLYTGQQHRWGRTQVLPLIGETQISNQGIIEVSSQEIADQIIEMMIGFEMMIPIEEMVEEPTLDVPKKEDNIQPKVEENDLGKTEKNDIIPQVEESDLIKAIKLSSFEELKELAKDFPKKEWYRLGQQKLQQYLIDKIQS